LPNILLLQSPYNLNPLVTCFDGWTNIQICLSWTLIPFQKKNDNTYVLLCHFCNFRGSWFILVFKLKPCSNTTITFVCFRRRNEYEKSLKKSHCWGTLLVKVMIMVGKLSHDVMDFARRLAMCHLSDFFLP
jgi:hypothetical protein